MICKNEILEYLSENKKYFLNRYNIIKIGIFGSFARNEQTENSDIDILIMMSPDTKEIFEKRMALKELIENYFSRKVDVCHENAIKPIFKKMILKDAVYV